MSLAASRFVPRRHRAIDGCFAVDRMRDRFTAAATQSSPKSRGSATSAPTRSLRVTSDLYLDDMRASMSVKKEFGMGSPMARRYAFVGHLRNAENIAAVIELLVSIIVSIMRSFGRQDRQTAARLNPAYCPVAPSRCCDHRIGEPRMSHVGKKPRPRGAAVSRIDALQRSDGARR